MRLFGKEFKPVAKNQNVDLYPKDLQGKINETNQWVYKINNGVYRSGFAQKQEAYEEAVNEVFENLERAEQILDQQRYLCDAKRVTESDVRLFVTLVRFDHVYHTHFKCNIKQIRDYPNLLNFMRDVYQMPGIAKTVDIEEIKQHYYRSHPKVNPFGIVAHGPELDFDKPHDREKRFGKPT